MIVDTTADHRQAISDILGASGEFDSDALTFVMETLDSHLADPDHAIWLTAMGNDDPVGVAYCAPEPVTSGTWNLLMLWTKKGFEGAGLGQSLVQSVEKQLEKMNVRLLIVETSHRFEAAQSFYAKAGFEREAEVKHFYSEGDHKLIYTKKIG